MSGEFSSSDFVSEQGSDTDQGETQRAQVEEWFGKLQGGLKEQPAAPTSERSELHGTESFSQESQMLREELEAAQNKMEGFFQKLAPKVQTSRRDSSGLGNYDSRESWNKQDKSSYLSVHSGFSAETLQHDHRFSRKDSEFESHTPNVKIDDAADPNLAISDTQNSVEELEVEKADPINERFDHIRKLAEELSSQTGKRLGFEAELQEYEKIQRIMSAVKIEERLRKEQTYREQLDALLNVPDGLGGLGADLFTEYVTNNFYAWLPAHLSRKCVLEQTSSSQSRCPHAGWYFEIKSDRQLLEYSRDMNAAVFSYKDPDLVPVDRNFHPLFIDCSGDTLTASHSTNSALTGNKAQVLRTHVGTDTQPTYFPVARDMCGARVDLLLSRDGRNMQDLSHMLTVRVTLGVCSTPHASVLLQWCDDQQHQRVLTSTCATATVRTTGCSQVQVRPQAHSTCTVALEVFGRTSAVDPFVRTLRTPV